MPRIKLQQKINAQKQVVFDLSRSIELHKISTAHTDEKAIAGKTEGLIELHESVTWKAKHFGIYQKLTSKVTALEFPNYFVDEMVSGAFKRFRHEHHFMDTNDGVIMRDVFDYESPFGFLGKIADYLFLENYMARLLQKRNLIIKEFAESGKWQKVLGKI